MNERTKKKEIEKEEVEKKERQKIDGGNFQANYVPWLECL